MPCLSHRGETLSQTSLQFTLQTSGLQGLSSSQARKPENPRVPENPLFSQTLESCVLGTDQEKSLSVQNPAQDPQGASQPAARVREIITRNLSQPESPGATSLPCPGSLLTSQQQ